MDLRAAAGRLRTELDDNSRPIRHPLVKGVEARSIDDREGQMMQPDIGASIERGRRIGRLDLPQRQDAVAIRNKRRRIVRPLADNAPSEAIAEELPRSRQVAYAQPYVIESVCARLAFVCHGSNHLELA